MHAYVCVHFKECVTENLNYTGKFFEKMFEKAYQVIAFYTLTLLVYK